MYKCDKCNKEYQSNGKHYKKHIENCKYGEPKKYFCKICGKEFNKPSAIGGHMACEHGKVNKKEKFKCKICGKEFITNKGAFENHLKNHDSEWKISRGKNISNGKIEFYSNTERSKYAREYMSGFMKENNPMYDKKNIDKMALSRRKYIDNLSDDEYSKMVINYINAPKKGNSVNHNGKYTPTKIEQMIIDLNIENLLYNGNKKDSKTIRFKNKNYRSSITPDFILENTNKVIETFGVYWHPKEDEELYKNAYNENGYEVLILWEDELYNNFNNCKNKIFEFIKEK